MPENKMQAERGQSFILRFEQKFSICKRERTGYDDNIKGGQS